MSSKRLKLDWIPRVNGMVAQDEHGEDILTADEYEAKFNAGDMEWSFSIESEEGTRDAQWIAEMAKPVLEMLYQKIGRERDRRRREKPSA